MSNVEGAGMILTLIGAILLVVYLCERSVRSQSGPRPNLHVPERATDLVTLRWYGDENRIGPTMHIPSSTLAEHIRTYGFPTMLECRKFGQKPDTVVL